MRSDRVRWPFRILAIVIGPLAVLTGVACLVGAVAVIFEQGWAGWAVATILLLLAGNALTFGPALIKAARTGHDPHVLDEDGW